MRIVGYLLCLLVFGSAAGAQTAPVPPTPPAQTPQGAQPPASTPLSPPTNSAAPTPPSANGSEPTRDANGVLTFRRTSRIVVLDVVVTDAAGNIVPGLTQNDFSVTENKEPQTVLHFDTAGTYSVPENASINSTAELDALAPRAPVNIILLDEFNTRFEDMAFARYSLKKFLDRQPDKLTTPTMLIAVSLENFTVLNDYTQNKAAILSALDHHFVAYPWQVHQFSWLPERYGTAFATLMRVAEATEGHPGHKSMIWIGRGFPPFNFANAPIDAENRVQSAVQNCVNMLRNARITLYVIDPAGVMINPGEYGRAAAFNDPFGGNYQFTALAQATGGQALYGRNDVDAEIGTSIRDGSSFYTLAYRPTNDSLDPQKFRRITVTLDRPGLKVTTRQGYYLQTPRALVDPQQQQQPSRRLLFDLSAADSSTMTYDAVPLSLTASVADPTSFTVHVDPRGLVWSPATDTDPRRTEVIVIYSTFDRKGKELNQVGRKISVAAPPEVPKTGRLMRGLDLNIKLDPNPKAVRARFVVRVSATGRIGTADANLGQMAAAAKQ